MSSKFVKTSPGPPPVLGQSGENNLVNWIIECSRRGFPKRKENIQTGIKPFLHNSNLKNPFRNNMPGDGWYNSFLKGHPTLSKRVPEGITNASSCVSETDIRNWFKEIFKYLSEENYLHILEEPSRIFNSDETCFMVSPKLKNVIGPRGVRNIYEVKKGDSKLNLIVLFTFSASGITTPPTLAYSYAGWMDTDIFYDDLKNIFHPYLIKEKITLPIFLFVDGHSSHTTLKTSHLCTELGIVLICLHPNSNRILQSADCFRMERNKSRNNINVG